ATDPIDRVRRFATAAGMWSADQEAVVLREILEEIDTAQRFVEGLPRPGAEAIFDHVYGSPAPRLERQRAETMRE
ncbi:MAG: pyruvate dehydrogenase (acetyl-transferring) E1 component subunit alpha, partial [bacterium]